MSYAPVSRNVVAHSSHRFIGGRCHRCGTSPRWPIAADVCPLRREDSSIPMRGPLSTRERIRHAFDLLDQGKSIRETARIVGVDRKTITRHKRLRANGDIES